MSVKPLWNLEPAPTARVPSPVPGVGIGTPWGKRPRGWPVKALVTYWRARWRHTGDDYPGAAGAPVLAVLDGTTDNLEDAVLGHVTLLYVTIGGRPFTLWYCHLSARTVPDGTRVRAGQQIGRVGETGTGAMGPHLHLEKRAGHTRSWAGPDLLPRWSA